MNCPHCGGVLEQNQETCSLCGTLIDSRDIYNNLVRRGTEAYEMSEFEKACTYYNKAYETGLYDAELCVRLGMVLDKKNDRRAAGMFLKALSFDFYNEHVHNLLIGFYDKYRRLSDLKTWYEKSRGSVEDAFIDKQITIINNLIKFREQAPSGPERAHSTAGETAGHFLLNSFKQYIMMNVVLGVVLLLIGIAVAIGWIFKVNVMVIVVFAVFILLAGMAFMVMARVRKMRKIKEGKRMELADIYKDFKK
ncbi:MAG: hypothetical protein LLG37_08975 [Spirochaetia bacterium]|nr:hypothetical protein [Spirochaetia bacterium]